MIARKGEHIMKGFMHWFKSSSKMKRWMFLILIGIILSCYGIAEVLVMKEMSFQEVGKIAIIFVIRFSLYNFWIDISK